MTPDGSPAAETQPDLGRRARAVRACALLAALVAVALAGCVNTPPSIPGCQVNCGTGSTTIAPEVQDRMDILGTVESERLAPVAGARVSVAELRLEATTDASGRFTFANVPSGVYTVRANATGYANATLPARPAGGALEFILAPSGPGEPFHVTLPAFHGYIECAAEALIITGPCDAATQKGGVTVFQNQSAFQFAVGPQWRSAVVDVVFDPSQSPALDALRVTLRAPGFGQDLANYQQYGRFSGAQSFTFTVEGNRTYPDGTAPVPANSTAFLLNVYPQGKEYQAACVPENPNLPPQAHPGECLLGVGGATNLRFDVYVTVFYVERAPEGFTLIR